jgi:hypothetical protein
MDKVGESRCLKAWRERECVERVVTVTTVRQFPEDCVSVHLVSCLAVTFMCESRELGVGIDSPM